MEIPEHIRFDFLLVVLGVVSLYFSLISSNKDSSVVFFVVGALSFVVGIYLIKYNYDLDMEIKELEYAKKKSEYIDFFEKRDALTKKVKKSIKETLKIWLIETKDIHFINAPSFFSPHG